MSDGGDISAAGTVNLPGWDMNMIADIRPRKVRNTQFEGHSDRSARSTEPRFNFDELTKDAITQGIGGLLKRSCRVSIQDRTLVQGRVPKVSSNKGN